ncbi:MAG: hypothetical protein IPK66_06200 [Rhodospirillales bacterium]|nr:hypothetical protein [Rhodospirillales bacterium]
MGTEIWRQRIGGLHEALADEAAKAEALALLRSLIERVTLVPERGQLAIELRGDLAAMLTFAANKRRSPGERPDLGAQVSLVAGARLGLHFLFAARGLDAREPLPA